MHLTLRGPRGGGFCDGVSRREFLRVGGLGLGGLSLSTLLREESRAGAGGSHKAVIMVFLAGGPPHQDMVDLKPEAPAEIRGEFKPIATNVPGIELCEHLPRLAKMTDKLAILRSIVGARGEHAAVQCLTGFSEQQSRLDGGRPALGSILSKLQGPVSADMPPFIGLSPRTHHAPWGDPGHPGYLGLAHSAFTPNGGDMESLKLQGISTERFADRRALLRTFDGLRRVAEGQDALAAQDVFTQRAFEILSSSRMMDALDVSKEDPKLRERYGIGDMKPIDDGPPCCMDHFLMARRLVEAGARCVTLSFGRWDYHTNNFGQCRERLPKLDMALSTLIEDLEERGLSKDVTVVVWGEFGRTPKINKDAGRDHWTPVSCAILAGGGLRTGQVIGATDRHGEVPKERPVSFSNVFATLYNRLGIDPATTLSDLSGRPMALLADTEPIHELI